MTSRFSLRNNTCPTKRLFAAIVQKLTASWRNDGEQIYVTWVTVFSPLREPQRDLHDLYGCGTAPRF